MWQHPEAGAATWSFSPKQWNECGETNRIRAIPSIRAEVRCTAIATTDDAKCPEQVLGGSFCLSENCSGFDIHHYRSDRIVELVNSHGYALSFRMNDLDL